MSRRFIPRLECLETRQVLDTMPVWTAGPLSPSGTLVGVIASPSPGDPIAEDMQASAPVTATPPMPPTEPLAASLPDPVPALDIPPPLADPLALPGGPAKLDIPPPLANPLAPPVAGPAKSSPSSPAELPAAKEAVSNSAYVDLAIPSADTTTTNKHEEATTAVVDTSAGKSALVGRGHATPSGPRLAGPVGVCPGNPDALHSPAAPREVVPEPAHAYGLATPRLDRRAGQPGNHSATRTHHALRLMTLPQVGEARSGPAFVVTGAGDGKLTPPTKGGAAVAEAASDGAAVLLTPAMLDELFLQSWNAPVAQGPAPPPGQLTSGRSSSRGGGGTCLSPLYLGVLPLPTGKPLDPVAAGYRYLCNYGRTAIYRAERRAGPLNDHEDIIQQICLEWLQQVGPPHEAFPRLLEHAAVEMQLLRVTVNRVIARMIYQQRKDRRRSGLVDWPAPARSTERDWMEFHSDCAEGVGHLTRLEWHVLEQRRQGKTFTEIGTELGVARQRVWEVYHEVEARLRRIYSDSGG